MSGIQDPNATPYEALLQFLYHAPIGLVQTTLEGEITMINPTAAQLLLPFAPDGTLLNLFDTLAAVAPQLRELAASCAEPSRTLCDAMRITAPPRASGQGGAAATVLSIRLVKLDQTTLMASVSDVTSAAQQEQAQLASEATRVTPTGKLLECLERSHIPLALFDPQERLAYANRSFLSSYWDGLDGMPTWDQMMRTSHQRKRGIQIDTDDIDGWLANVRLRYRQEPRRTFESDMTDGRWMRVNEETHEDGWQLTVSTDVTGLKANEAVLRRAHDVALMASITDPLTGLPNRRYVFDRLAALMAEASELRIPLTLVAIDLDAFKSINDTHGHAVGDRVLQWFAERLAATVRQHDAVGRIGGEEFLLVLANTECQGAQRVLRDLRSALFDAPLLLQTASLRIGFSAGVAEAEFGEQPDALCVRADQALYCAKNAGRNQDCFVEGRKPAGQAFRRSQPQGLKPLDT